MENSLAVSWKAHLQRPHPRNSAPGNLPERKQRLRVCRKTCAHVFTAALFSFKLFIFNWRTTLPQLVSCQASAWPGLSAHAPLGSLPLPLLWVNAELQVLSSLCHTAKFHGLPRFTVLMHIFQFRFLSSSHHSSSSLCPQALSLCLYFCITCCKR